MKLRERLERVMFAVTFAEAGEWEIAAASLKKESRTKRKKDRLIRVTRCEDKRASLRL